MKLSISIKKQLQSKLRTSGTGLLQLFLFNDEFPTDYPRLYLDVALYIRTMEDRISFNHWVILFILEADKQGDL
jgi:hypothetical protein